jgi:DNA-binding response OmpR family regulator
MNEFTRPVSGLSILIVEDDALIALDCQQSLQDAGANHVDIAKTHAEVTRLLAVHSFDIAVIDIFLGAESGVPIALAMSAAGIPFIFCSGGSNVVDLPASLRRVLLVQKPYSFLELVEAIRVTALKPR